MRKAVVDIGSNSTRLLVAQLEDGRVTEELARRTTVTRLGSGVDASGNLSDEAMERVFRTLGEYREVIGSYDVDAAVAVLTSAVRDAGNGKQFADTIRQRYGLTPHILTGEQEARLTFLGAMSERDPEDPTPTLVIDIGGGSTEFVIGVGHEPSFHVSNQAGVVRHTERHIHHDPRSVASSPRSPATYEQFSSVPFPPSSAERSPMRSRSPGRRRHLRRSPRSWTPMTRAKCTGT